MTKVYKRQQTQYCSRCHNEYDFSGNSTGYFGSNLTKKQYRERQQAENIRSGII